MTAKEQLIRLVRIQELVTAVREAQRTVAAAPGRIEEIEGHFRERNAEFVALQDRHDELELDRKTRSEELKVLEEHKTKYTADLMQVKNQKEYAAMLKEIDAVKAQISEHEDAILRDMEEIEKLQGELATHKEHIDTERAAVAEETKQVEGASEEARDTIEKLTAQRTEQATGLSTTMLGNVRRLIDRRQGVFLSRAEETKQVEGAAEEARKTIEELTAQRKEQATGLSTTMLGNVRRLIDRRQGVFLSRAEDGTCQSCYVRVRPQVFQEIKLAAAVHSCGNCRRYLVYDAGIRAAMEEPATDAVAPADPPAQPDGGIETINRGAV